MDESPHISNEGGSKQRVVEELSKTGPRETLLVEDNGELSVLKTGPSDDKYLQQEIWDLTLAQGIAGIPKIIRKGVSEDGTIFVQRQYIHGHTLENKENISDPAKRQQLIEIVDALHARGINCLDLFQYNLVDSDDQIYLVDLGRRTDFDQVDTQNALRMDVEALKRILG